MKSILLTGTSAKNFDLLIELAKQLGFTVQIKENQAYIIDEKIYQLNEEEEEYIVKSKKEFEEGKGIDSKEVSSILKRYL